MDLFNSPNYLLSKQYHKADNLNARIKLHLLYSTTKHDWYQFVRQLLNLQPNSALLALGEGNGMQWRSQQEELPEGFSAFLSDFSLGMIREAQDNLGSKPGFGFACLDAQHVPFAAHQFDLVTANHMLYHVPNPDFAIAEAARVLKLTGLFVAATNGIGHMEELQQLLVDFEPSFPRRFRYFDSFTLESGVDRLKPFFVDVNRVDFEENLWVTNAMDLADYAFSMPSMQETIQAERKAELVNYFQGLINKDGGIFISKATGVLVGKIPNSAT